MKDIERRLEQHAPRPTPRRPLSRNFTAVTLQRIHEVPQRTPMLTRLAAFVQGVPHMQKLTKPAALALGIAVIGVMAAGTGYAALKWLQPHSTIDKNSVTTLPNGNVRFMIHHENCQLQDQDGPSDSYYEIKAGSSVTPDNLRAGIEATCEEDLLMELFPEIIEETKGMTAQNFQPGSKQYFTPWVKIKEVGKDYIATESKLNGRTYGDARLPIDTNARFYEKGQPIKLDSFKAGDWITLVSYTTSLDKPFLTESTSPDDIETLLKDGFPIGTRIGGMIKRQYDPELRAKAEGVMGKDWTRLERDEKSADGWRQVVPLDGDWDTYKKQFENQ